MLAHIQKEYESLQEQKNEQTIHLSRRKKEHEEICRQLLFDYIFNSANEPDSGEE